MAPVVAAGRGAVLVLHDITDLRRADQIRRDFVANVSHELRTPLTAIKGYVEALIDEVDEQDDASAASSTSSTATRRAWSAWSRTCCGSRGSMPARRLTETVPLRLEGHVIGNLWTTSRGAGEEAAVRWTYPPRPRRMVDPAKLHDIVRNLVENAINYTPEGGVIDIAADVLDERVSTHRRRTPAGNPRGRPRACVRTLLSRRQVARAAGRHGPRPRHRPHMVDVLGGEVRSTTGRRRRPLHNAPAVPPERRREDRRTKN